MVSAYTIPCLFLRKVVVSFRNTNSLFPVYMNMYFFNEIIHYLYKCFFFLEIQIGYKKISKRYNLKLRRYL